MKTISGPFEVRGSPLDLDETTKAVGAMRMRFDKRFSGPFDGRGTVTFLGVMDKEIGSGGYVGLELIEATIEGRKGTFLFQHSCTMTRGRQEQSITVVPDSGKGELSGINGKMTIEIKEDGQHFYKFDYSLT